MKSTWIELHLECHVNGNEQLAELGIETDKSEWRVCGVFIEWIGLFYPHSDGGTMIEVGGADLHFRESYDEVKKKIDSACNE